MTGQIENIFFNVDGKVVIALSVNEKTEFHSLKDQLLDIEIKKHREKRSLTANAYAWVLIGKMAEALKTSPDEVYHLMLVQYGQNDIDENGSVKTISTYAELTGWLYVHSAEIGKTELNDKLFTHYRILLGSSDYDSKQMATLIDGIVSECKELDIETMPPDQLLAMCDRWGK